MIDTMKQSIKSYTKDIAIYWKTYKEEKKRQKHD